MQHTSRRAWPRRAWLWLGLLVLVGIVALGIVRQPAFSVADGSPPSKRPSTATREPGFSGSPLDRDANAREAWSRPEASAHSDSSPAGSSPVGSTSPDDRTRLAQAASRPAARTPDPQPLATPRLPERPATEPTGGLKDRTGWKGSLGEQLNRDLMPLVDECIELARERRPALAGMLAISLVVAPTERPGQAIVARADPAPQNEIDDPELFECIEQSTFTLEGLDAPSDFTITIPIDRQP